MTTATREHQTVCPLGAWKMSQKNHVGIRAPKVRQATEKSHQTDY